jgi:signal transduction histidine kinase
MGPSKYHHRLIAEVSHQINSPLAAIRNALYLAAQRTKDVELLRYLQLADEEVSAIVLRIRELRDNIDLGHRGKECPTLPHPWCRVFEKRRKLQVGFTRQPVLSCGSVVVRHFHVWCLISVAIPRTLR